MCRSTLLACFTLLLFGGCATYAAHRPATTADHSLLPSEHPDVVRLRVTLKNTLDQLPALELESFDAFVARARDAVVAQFAPEATSLVLQFELPMDEWSVEFRRSIYPVLVANWAKSRLQEKRKSYLSALIQHPTHHVSGQEIPGRNAAFDGFERELHAQVADLGLTVQDVERVAYEVMLPDAPTQDRNRQVGVLVHADVVPADEPGWAVPPFAGTIADDRIVGRGAMDDKGPLVAALFALAALRDSNVARRSDPVLIIGTSEETHWHGIERLVAKRGLPRSVFVADGGFPAGIGEKGVTTVRIRTESSMQKATRPMHADRLRLVSFEGGQVPNQVPATATARLRPLSPSLLSGWQNRLELNAAQYPGVEIEVDTTEDDLIVRALGKAAHGASPDKGVNAVSHLARFLMERLQFADSPCAQLLWILDRQLGVGTDGSALGVTDQHPAFSAATVNLGTFRQLEDENCEAALNIRWPPPRTPDEIVSAVRTAVLREAELLPGTATLQLDIRGGGLPPYLADQNSPLVVALLSAYEHVTGAQAEALTLSGTTYAKAVPGGGITFGPGMAEEKGARIHVPNEHLTFTEFDRLVEIYTFALARLCIE